MKNVLDYLTWEHVELGVRIIGCDKSFEGALEVPVLIDGRLVVEISNMAFANCGTIVSVVIPDSVEVIDEDAFWKCLGLEELRLGAGVKRIESCSFYECRLLKSVVIPDSVEVIGELSFALCAGLEELRLGAGVKTIRDFAFYECSSLKSVVIPDSVEVIGEFAFAKCDGLEELRLGAAIKKIEKKRLNTAVRSSWLQTSIQSKTSAQTRSPIATSWNHGKVSRQTYRNI